jgi:hypothetical protein
MMARIRLSWSVVVATGLRSIALVSALLVFPISGLWPENNLSLEVRGERGPFALQPVKPKVAFPRGLSAGLGSAVAYAEEPECPEGTLIEPYQNICAAIRDVRNEFIPSLGPLAEPSVSAVTREFQGPEKEAPGVTDPTFLDEEPPEPGTIAAGVRYVTGSHSVINSAHLHTKMFVYPEGLNAGSLPGWLYMPATNRVDLSVELVGMYRSWSDARGLLGLFGRPCSVEYPCPNGSTGNSWQFYRLMDELTCNITHGVDRGGHPHLMIHYANHSDRLDDGDPPLWRNAVYLWNYCAGCWDLIWSHEYRQNKLACGGGAGGACSWGPAFEIFGEELYPPIRELGYEQSLLIHDGVRSELRPIDGATYTMPESFPQRVPWVTWHLDPNRGFGVGNFVVENSAPEIQGQNPVQTLEDEPLELVVDDLQIFDPDVNPAYHVAFTLTAYEGENFILDGLTVQPAEDFCGQLSVPVTVSDGGMDSDVFQLVVNVLPVNDPPAITGQTALATVERTPLAITLAQITVEDPDNSLSELTLQVHDGVGYRREGNVITPTPGTIGTIQVVVTVTDGELTSPEFNLLVTVTPDVVPPVITLLGPATVTLPLGATYTESGATAWDDVDGDISSRVRIQSNVNTAVPGSYSVTYTVSDLAGNAAKPATRQVVVQRGDGGCFIATAAYGSHLDPHLDVLRAFRDRRLMTSRPGRRLVGHYYRVSPPIACFIAKRPALRFAVRTALTPVIHGIAWAEYRINSEEDIKP